MLWDPRKLAWALVPYVRAVFPVADLIRVESMGFGVCPALISFVTARVLSFLFLRQSLTVVQARLELTGSPSTFSLPNVGMTWMSYRTCLMLN